MAYENALTLEILLESGDDLGAGELKAVVDYVESFGHAIAVQGVQEILDDVGAPSTLRAEILRELTTPAVRRATPIIITALRRGSWSLESLVPYAAAIFILTQLLTPTLQQAFQGTDMQKLAVRLLKTNIFKRARRAAEEVAHEKPQIANLAVKSIKDDTQVYDGQWIPKVTITLERREIVSVTLEDKELVHNLVSRLRQH